MLWTSLMRSIIETTSVFKFESIVLKIYVVSNRQHMYKSTIIII